MTSSEVVLYNFHKEINCARPFKFAQEKEIWTLNTNIGKELTKNKSRSPTIYLHSFRIFLPNCNNEQQIEKINPAYWPEGETFKTKRKGKKLQTSHHKEKKVKLTFIELYAIYEISWRSVTTILRHFCSKFWNGKMNFIVVNFRDGNSIIKNLIH